MTYNESHISQLKRYLRYTVARLVAVSVTAMAAMGLTVVPVSAQPSPIGVSGQWTLAFDEEFTSSGLNASVWTPGWQHGGISGPMSEKCLSAANVSQPGNGYIYLELKKEANTCEYGSERGSVSNTGALVESNAGDGVSGHLGFAYSSEGYVEWRADVPGVEPAGWNCPKAGGCLPDWPALWSLPQSHETEIDTMEGLQGLACYHFHPPWGGGIGGCASGSYGGTHTYGSEWVPGAVTYYYDGNDVGQTSSSNVNSTSQYLVMDMIPTGAGGGPLIVPDVMAVDYVRVWMRMPAFLLRTADTSGEANLAAQVGAPGDIPVVGDWTGDGKGSRLYN